MTFARLSVPVSDFRQDQAHRILLVQRLQPALGANNVANNAAVAQLLTQLLKFALTFMSHNPNTRTDRPSAEGIYSPSYNSRNRASESIEECTILCIESGINESSRVDDNC